MAPSASPARALWVAPPRPPPALHSAPEAPLPPRRARGQRAAEPPALPTRFPWPCSLPHPRHFRTAAVLPPMSARFKRPIPAWVSPLPPPPPCAPVPTPAPSRPPHPTSSPAPSPPHPPPPPPRPPRLTPPHS